ncbi:unnamed protein product [Rotaria sp. Silwood2]|nr:unnamed protein product [Rotaria sp. Silwood2]
MELFSLTTNTTITGLRWHAYPIGFFLVLLCLFTIIGNFLIIYLVIRESTLHTSKYYYIASLAFADLLVGLIVMPFAFIFTMTDDEYWLFPRHLRFICEFWHSIDIFASTASIYGLSAIGLDRYVAITKPMKYPNSFISKRWYYVLSFIWIFSAVISFPAVIHFGTERLLSRRSTVTNQTISTPSLLSKECEFPNNPYYILFTTMVSFYLPLIVMIYVYIQVYLAAKRQTLALRSGYIRPYFIQSAKSWIPKFHLTQTLTEKRPRMKKPVKISYKSVHEKSDMLLQNRRLPRELLTLRIHYGSYQYPTIESTNQNHEHDSKFLHKVPRQYVRRRNFWRRISKDQKATKFIGIVMSAFIGCWLPVFVYLTLSGVFGLRLKDDQNHELLFNILTWLGYANSALDILVYVFTSKELRTICLKVFSKSSH